MARCLLRALDASAVGLVGVVGPVVVAFSSAFALAFAALILRVMPHWRPLAPGTGQGLGTGLNWRSSMATPRLVTTRMRRDPLLAYRVNQWTAARIEQTVHRWGLGFEKASF